MIDVKNNIPNFIMLTPGNVHDTQAMDSLPVEAGAYYLMDKGYVDFDRLFRLFQQQKAYFVTRAKDNMKYSVFEAREVDRQTGVISDESIAICDYLLLIIALKMYHIEQNLYIFSNVIGQVLFERTPLNELFDKPIINQNPEDDRQLSLW